MGGNLYIFYWNRKHSGRCSYIYLVGGVYACLSGFSVFSHWLDLGWALSILLALPLLLADWLCVEFLGRGLRGVRDV